MLLPSDDNNYPKHRQHLTALLNQVPATYRFDPKVRLYNLFSFITITFLTTSWLV